jgi:hypothetical protein
MNVNGKILGVVLLLSAVGAFGQRSDSMNPDKEIEAFLPGDGLVFFSGGIVSAPRRLEIDFHQGELRWFQGSKKGESATSLRKPGDRQTLSKAEVQHIRKELGAIQKATATDFMNMPPIADFDVRLIWRTDGKTGEVDSYGPPRGKMDELYGYLWGLTK